MLDRRLKLGTLWGIGVYVHWTFLLLVAYVAYMASSEGIGFVAFNVLLLLHVFGCVTLHEYGHALTARRFGIPTLDITLLPIGGVARLHRMPRQPWQEFLVAVAGPAVNVAIASTLFVVLLVFRSDALSSLTPVEWSNEFFDRLNLLMEDTSVTAFVLLLMCVNIALILFNLIPAFPMDGGRVLRSFLAMKLEYRKATYIACGIGVSCAALMAFAAIQNGMVTAVLIAMFVVYAGVAETRQVDIMERVRGLVVGDVMIRQPISLPMDDLATDLPSRWQELPLTSVPVVGLDRFVVGMLSSDQVAKALENAPDRQWTVGELLADLAEKSDAPSAPKLTVEEPLDEVMLTVGKRQRILPVVNDVGQLIGILDLNHLAGRIGLTRLQGTENAESTLGPRHPEFF